MVAAATAVDNGATVIVLEKMVMLGGNTARSEGNMSAMDPEPEKLLPMTQAVRDIIAKYTNPKPSFRRRFSSSSPSMTPLARSTSLTLPSSLRFRRSSAATARTTPSSFSR